MRKQEKKDVKVARTSLLDTQETMLKMIISLNSDNNSKKTTARRHKLLVKGKRVQQQRDEEEEQSHEKKGKRRREMKRTKKIPVKKIPETILERTAKRERAFHHV